MSVAALLAGKSSAIVTLQPTDTVAAAADLLGRNRIGAVIIVKGTDQVAGILSERDIVRGLAADGAAVLDQDISQLMTAPVETCTPSESAETVMRRMTDGRFRHMPVTEQGRLIGVISIGDVVKNRIDTLQNEKDAMRDYIMTG